MKFINTMCVTALALGFGSVGFAQTATKTAPDSLCQFFQDENYQGQRYDVMGGDVVYYQKDVLSLISQHFPQQSTPLRPFLVEVVNPENGFKSIKVPKNCQIVAYVDYNLPSNGCTMLYDADSAKVDFRSPTEGGWLNAVSCECH